MDEYINLIRNSLSYVDDVYFLLPTTYRKIGITRERIFCYELYHQMRLIARERSDIFIHGEVDKAGHRHFDPDHRANPDFVFHRPGSFDDNSVVVEVKGTLKKLGVVKDFTTLLNFTEFYHYKIGIFIIFNYSLAQFKQRRQSELMLLKQRVSADRILVIAIKQPHAECEMEYLSEMFM